MSMLKTLWTKIKTLFNKKPVLKSSEDVHWVNHICDEFVPPPGPAVQHYNLHGFDEGPGAVYWLGLDCRNFFIRTCDYVIKFHNKATYDKYIGIARNGGSALLKAVEADSALSMRRGNNVNIEFVFKWGDDDKTFDVHLVGDFFAEEK